MIELIFIKGSSFLMGDTLNDYLKDGRPTHLVSLDSFYISKYLITQEIWGNVMNNNPSNYMNTKSPVEMVSWIDCIKFCNRLSNNSKLESCYYFNRDTVICDFKKNGYRLPKEAEWEFAARGGNMNYKYSGSDTIDEVAWFKKIQKLQHTR